MLELGKQIWPLPPQHLDDSIPLLAPLALFLWDGAAIELSSDMIYVGDNAATNPASS
jgi:hypothetical protein